MAVRIERSSLTITSKLGEGGQGRVWKLSDGQVLKEYFDPELIQERELYRLVSWRRGLAVQDRSLCDSMFAWPRRVVVRGGKAVGFLMRAVPNHFYCSFSIAGSEVHRLCEVQYLMFPRKASWTGVPVVDMPQRILIAKAAVAAVALLHRDGFVLGDISMTNVLWSNINGGAVFLIDCDGVRKLSYKPVVPQASTPDWDDPLDPYRATISSDRYKLALLVGRILSNSYSWRPGDFLPELGPRLNGVRTMSANMASASRHNRPSAHDWLAALSGRPVLRLRG
jgi:DNA-binding helix-hairpin-helix protein with protein kinase domain